jgi:hypothetical protein
MSISIVIPQIFYDIIARVLPGYLFLFSLGASIYNDIYWFGRVGNPQDNSWYILFIMMEVFILSYFAGWILRTISCYGMDDMMMAKMIARKDRPTIKEKYQIIRLKNPDAGFRIIKLRAEIRMLEASRNGFVLVILISIMQLIADKSDISPAFIGKIILFLLLALVFQKAIRPAFDNYIGNIESIYEIINPPQMPAQSKNAS